VTLKKTADETVRVLIEAAVKAGERAMADWRTEKEIRYKPDGSPHTDTDLAMEAIMLAAILSVSDHKIIAEEAVHAGKTPVLEAGEPFWLVDALDGTRDFVGGLPDFTVNVALIEDGQPTLGVIHAPAEKITWYAIAGLGAFKIENGVTAAIQMRETPAEGLFLLSGVRAGAPEVLEPFIGAHVVAERRKRSSSLKFCLLAEGKADLYPRQQATYEWDIAAGDIIMREAGGIVIDMETRKSIAYGKVGVGFENGGFIAGRQDIFRFAVQ
jgi:3'(2'), 5'-bisphosphate nucleotidase